MAATAARRVVREIPRASLFVYSTEAVQKMIVAAYARVSTEKEEQEDSFERQVEHYTALIKSKDEWEFGGIYADEAVIIGLKTLRLKKC